MARPAGPDPASHGRRSVRRVDARTRARAVIAAAATLLLITLAVPGLGPQRVARAEDLDPLLAFLREAAFFEGKSVIVEGDIVRVEDPFDDQIGFANPFTDITSATNAWGGGIPPVFLEDDGFLACDQINVACSVHGSDPMRFAGGFAVVGLQVADDVEARDRARRIEYGALAALDRFPTVPTAPAGQFSAFGGGSHFWIVRLEGSQRGVFLYAFSQGAISEFRTHARAVWQGQDIFVFIPVEKEWRDPVAWDAYAYSSDGTEAGTGRDALRSDTSVPMAAFVAGPDVEFSDEPPAPSVSDVPSTDPNASGAVGSSSPGSTAASADPNATTPSPAPSAGGSDPTGGVFGDPAILLGLGALLALIAIWLIVRWLRGRRPEPPAYGPTRERPRPTSDDGSPGAGGANGGGGPAIPGGGPGGPVPPPPDGDCEDGDEEWRPDKPPAAFLVPPDDAKVKITADPTTPALEAWLESFGPPRGVPIPAFVAVETGAGPHAPATGVAAPTLDDLLAGLPDPTTVHWRIEVELLEYRLACERKWVCEDGVWVATNEKRVVESGPDPYLGRWVVDGPDRPIGDIRRIWAQAQQALHGAEAGMAAMEAYARTC